MMIRQLFILLIMLAWSIALLATILPAFPAKAELYNRIKSSMLLFRLYKGDSNGYCIEVFTEKDIDLLYSIFVDFVNWANLNEYWSQRRNDIKFADFKKELVIKQQDIIEKIKSKENHTERELNYAVNTLNVIKKMN